MTEQMYISLHTHSDRGSLKDGAQTCEAIASKAAKCGMESVALTDHGMCGGLLEFKKACEKNNIRPIYGSELYLAPTSRLLHEKIEGFKPASHMVVLAKNNNGVKNLFKLCSIGWTEGYYYRPRVDLEVLEKYKDDLIITSGCGAGLIPQLLEQNRIEEVISHAKKLRDIFKDDFYLEVQNHGLDWQQPLKKQLFDLSRELNIPIIATQDSHYIDKEDAEMHKHITRLAAGNLEFEGKESYFKTPKEFYEMWNKDELHAVERTNEVAKKCKSEWEFGKTIWPVYDLPKNITPVQKLRELAEKGLNKLFSNPTKIYKERLEYELDIIEKMGFPTYFLVVQDFIHWAENNDVLVGAGRGSAAASLVCYCIGITKVDPIKYNLPFERFLNPARISNPDIDTDYDTNGRQKVIQYVYDKYGFDRCAQIATYSYFKPRGALRDFARTYNYLPSVGDKLAKMVPPDKNGKQVKFKELIKDNPEILKHSAKDVIKLVEQTEGMVKNIGIHAAGLVVSDNDISTQLPLFLGKGKEIASQFDKDEVEEIGLVKFDFLGLRNLSVIKDTLNSIKKNYNIDININNINVEDEEVYKNIFQRGKLDGIFQFETSGGFKDLCYKVKPTNINDLAAITSLYRPGPMGTGATNEFAERRAGKEFEYEIPELAPILNETVGIMCYQESVMQICTDLAGYTMAEADNMRKIIGKKIEEKMKLERTKFVDGCVKNNIDKGKANKLFNDIEGFAAYSFNKGHAVAYSIISYQTAWLKYYYPIEFYTALLNSCEDNQDRMIKYIYSAREEEIDIMPPDINKSDKKFSTDGKTITFGFLGIKGIAEKGTDKIIELRNKLVSINSVEDLVNNGIGKKDIVPLIKSGALEEIIKYSREQLIENIDDIIKYYRSIPAYKTKHEQVLQRLKEIEIWEQNKEGKKPRPLKEMKEPVFPDIKKETELKRNDRLRLEKETLGYYLSGNPLDEYQNLLKMAEYDIDKIKEGLTTNKQKISIPIVLNKINKIRTKKDKIMANILVEDKTGIQNVTIFPKTWNKYGESLEEGEIYALKCFVEKTISDDEDATPIVNLIATGFEKIEEASIKIEPIMIELNDKSQWEFIPDENQQLNLWQQARLIANNMKGI